MENQTTDLGAIAFKMRKFNDSISLLINKELWKCGLTTSQFELLYFLSQRKGEETAIKDIEKFMQLTHPTVLGIVARLCAKGYVKTATSEKDKRVRLVSLTDRNIDLEEQQRKIQAAILAEIKQNFSKSELETLAESLNCLIKIIE